MFPNPEFPINSFWTQRAYRPSICILIGFAYRDVEARVRNVVTRSQMGMQRRGRVQLAGDINSWSCSPTLSGQVAAAGPCLCTTCQCTDYRPCVSGSSLWNDLLDLLQATHTDDRHGRCHPVDTALPLLLVILRLFYSLICSHTDYFSAIVSLKSHVYLAEIDDKHKSMVTVFPAICTNCWSASTATTVRQKSSTMLVSVVQQQWMTVPLDCVNTALK